MDSGKIIKDKYSVKYNNIVIFTSTDKTIAVEFAIMLHRASNEPHSIDICSKDSIIDSLFTRK